MARSIFSISFFFIFAKIGFCAEEPMTEEKKLPEQAERLKICEPQKSMKFKTEKSKKHEEDYDIAVDPEEAKKSGIDKKEIEKAMKDAMDASDDRRENGSIKIELEETEEEINGNEKNVVEQKPPDVKKTTLVGKIQKKDAPKNSYADSKKPAVQRFKIGVNKYLKITAEGACEDQNKKLLEAVNIDPPT